MEETLYCEICRILTEEKKCPLCGRKKLRPVKDDDPCFLTERDRIWSGMLKDVLEQNRIPCQTKGKMGAGLAIRVGPNFESERVYVPYVFLPQARELVAELFPEEEAVPEEEF